MKMNKIMKLKENLDKDEFLLKKQYMMLLKEKSLYANKLKEICAIGNNLDWEDAHGIL